MTIDEEEEKEYLQSWFIGACEGGHVDIVREHKIIVFENEKIACADVIEATVMHGHLDVVNEILPHVILSQAKFEYFDLVVTSACEYGHVHILQELRKRWNATRMCVGVGHALAAANGRVPVLA